jgi:hypothetical protein
MKKISILFLILFSLGCDLEDENACADIEIDVSACETFIDVASPCIITEVEEWRFDELSAKYIYYHNGLNYNKIERYQLNGSGVFNLDETITMEYEGSNIVGVVIQRDRESMYKRFTFEYSDQNLKTTYEEMEGETVLFGKISNQFFVNNPQNGFYVGRTFYDILSLREFKDGNAIRIFSETNEGCLIDGQNWLLSAKLIFDRNPNIFQDYAVRYPIDVEFNMGMHTGYPGRVWLGYDRNNMIASVSRGTINSNFDRAEKRCYTFLKSDDELWIKEFKSTSYPNTKHVYKYSCE